MNVAMWILVGGAVGWAGFYWLNFNMQRGITASIAIGMAAGCFGGYVLAPLLGSATLDPGHFNPLSLFTAFASAAGFVIVSNMIYDRFGV
jgi:uncharacterized membrane protein YeaQ/YmgE (transglycosylase-associated protein family)